VSRRKLFLLVGALFALLAGAAAYGHYIQNSFTGNNVSGQRNYDKHPWFNADQGKWIAEWGITATAGDESLIAEQEIPRLQKINNVFTDSLFPNILVLGGSIHYSTATESCSSPDVLFRGSLEDGLPDECYDTNSGPQNRGDGFVAVNILTKWNNTPNFDNTRVALRHSSQMTQGSPSTNFIEHKFWFCDSDPCPT